MLTRLASWQPVAAARVLALLCFVFCSHDHGGVGGLGCPTGARAHPWPHPLCTGLPNSYVDTIDGSYNHALRVSTRMENTQVCYSMYY